MSRADSRAGQDPGTHCPVFPELRGSQHAKTFTFKTGTVQASQEAVTPAGNHRNRLEAASSLDGVGVLEETLVHSLGAGRTDLASTLKECRGHGAAAGPTPKSPACR